MAPLPHVFMAYRSSEETILTLRIILRLTFEYARDNINVFGQQSLSTCNLSLGQCYTF